MPVQKKSNTAAPGEKKKKNWLQIAVVAFVVIVVVMCVLSFSNFSNLFSNTNNGQVTSGATIAEGDPVAIYFATNIGNQTTFAYASENTNEIPPIRIVADSNSSIVDNDYSSIQIGNGNVNLPYGIYAAEKNAIAKAVVGKKYGETITVPTDFMALGSITADEVKAMGYDINELKVGDIIIMSLGYTDVLGNQDAYLRYGVVRAINDDLSGISVNCGSDTITAVTVGKYSA